jgi:Fe-S oxidoreductase
MGWIYWWARLTSLAPRLANFFSQTPGLAAVAKWVGGIAQQRQMPAFATQTFKEWYASRPVHNQGRPPVILWPDTFNNYFHPWVARAAVEVLENAGYQVWVPKASLCCGRPLYDFGMLDDAKHLLRQILTTLQPQIEAGIPVVGLEPSCLVIFRDELANLFPNHRNAWRLSGQSYVLSEFLMKKVENYQPPRLARKALLHGHCHHKSVIGMEDELELLKKMGLAFEEPERGCCGMAGSFGIEAPHYDVSMKVGEQHLLPAVRQADNAMLIVANGFSCKEQILQGAGRRALHLAELLQMALHAGTRAEWEEERVSSNGGTRRTRAALVGAGVVAGGLLARAGYRRVMR